MRLWKNGGSWRPGLPGKFPLKNGNFFLQCTNMTRVSSLAGISVFFPESCKYAEVFFFFFSIKTSIVLKVIAYDMYYIVMKWFFTWQPIKQAAYNQAARGPTAFQRALLSLLADSNRGPRDWDSIVLSTEPQQLISLLGTLLCCNLQVHV